ncbi:MAG: phage N-6-adenine-methyltransferase [Lachnospiraceae bacterium]|nr:phage N-6-adenine-methyltransferase [Lachnospiraceae bacterium]
MTEKTRKILHSSEKDDWGTPPWLFNLLHQKYEFTVDLCAKPHNALLPRWCQNLGNGNEVFYAVGKRKIHRESPITWTREVFFCNPPYGRGIGKLLASIPDHARGVLLLPSRTGSQWFAEIIGRASSVNYLTGRLIFAGATSPAPFDSVLMTIGDVMPVNQIGELKGHGWALSEIQRER